jgi:apolipoprotein N-acyltransferase
MTLRKRLALSLLSGLLEPLGYTGFGFFPLTWIAKVPILFAVHDLSARRAFLITLVYGSVAYFGGYYWLAHTFSTFGGFSDFAACLGTFFICTCLGLSFGLLMAFTQCFRARGLAPVWSLTFVTPAIELLFPNIFPYNIGASQYRFTAITQFIENTGMLGLTALIMLVNGAVYELIESRYLGRQCIHRRWLVPMGTFVVALVYGLVRIDQIDSKNATAPTLRVALIQANLKVQTQNNALESFQAYQDMTRPLAAAQTIPDLVIWPETALRFAIQQTNLTFPKSLRQSLPLLTGSFSLSSDKHLHNSLLAIESDGQITSRYDKRSLLAFGEMIPFEKQVPWLRQWLPRAGKMTAGSSLNHLTLAGATFLPTICYEAIQPKLTREIWQHSGPADALINVTNDAWFGDTHEPRTHLALASFRAIETRRSLIRSTTTGISALVDPAGRISAQTDQYSREVLLGSIPLITDGSTTFYLRYGEWFGWLCIAITISLMLVKSRSESLH